MENFLQKTPTQQKAYAIAFVLTVKQVFAQDATKKVSASSQFQELLDQIVQSVKEPSADHLNIYIGLAIAMSFLGYFLYVSLGLGKPKLCKEQLFLSDVVDSSSKAVDKEDAFHKKLDQNGPYAREPTGILTRESILKLRTLINEKAYLEYRPRQLELMNERVELLRQNKQHEYQHLIQSAGNEFRDITQKAFESALSFLDISEEDYIKSFQIIMQEPDCQRMLERLEMEMRDKHEPINPITKTLAQAKKIYQEKLQMEVQNEAHIQQAAAQNPQQVPMMQMMMRTQLYDKIYMHHGLKSLDFNRLVKEYNLDNDPEIQAMQKSISQNKDKAIEMQQKAQQEMKNEMDSLLTEEYKKRYEIEVQKLGKIEGGPNGIMTIDNFIKIQSLIMKYANEITFKSMADFKAKRRSFLKNQNEQKYQECIGKFLATQKVIHQNLANVFVGFSKTDMAVYNNSGQFYSNQEKFSQVMNELTLQMTIAYEQSVGKVVTAEKAIAAVKRIEDAKIVSIDNIQRAAKAGKIPQHAVPIILEVDKSRVIDKLFFDEQIDNEDIGKTVRELKLHEDEKFKNMLMECQQKFQAAQASWQ